MHTSNNDGDDIIVKENNKIFFFVLKICKEDNIIDVRFRNKNLCVERDVQVMINWYTKIERPEKESNANERARKRETEKEEREKGNSIAVKSKPDYKNINIQKKKE
jgi:hypothetical protein